MCRIVAEKPLLSIHPIKDLRGFKNPGGLIDVIHALISTLMSNYPGVSIVGAVATLTPTDPPACRSVAQKPTLAT